MSAANRGAVRSEKDFYPTDPRLVRALLRASDAGELPPIPKGGIWVEPALGDGPIVRAVEEVWPGHGREWITCDVREETGADIIGDFTQPSIAEGGNVYITNPPFSNGLQVRFAQSAIEKRAPGGIVILLVNNHFFGPRSICIDEKGHRSGDRIKWHKEHRCSRVQLSPRPSFGVNKDGKKGSDQCTYEWAVWGWDDGGRWYGPIDWSEA